MTAINKNKQALWIGRFQPFHLGHMHVLREILEGYSSLTIVIGSAQEDYTPRNPLTAKEREKMIKNIMNSIGVKSNRYKIILSDDIATNSFWPRYVAKKSGFFSEVVTSSPLTKILFEDSNYKVIEHHMYNRKNYSGTEVRKRILRGNSWEYLVPVSVFIDLQKIRIERRIKEISRSDNPYS
jgi:nicotinamide-nucleotide adenylyltransferase